ncbi:hypothetical protein RP20_CCG002206 [Aedes albopictus]|nr:hypothetical protein RP20_CCG002206 [Aedes albopictus]
MFVIRKASTLGAAPLLGFFLIVGGCQRGWGLNVKILSITSPPLSLALSLACRSSESHPVLSVFFLSDPPENRCIELHSPDGIHSCILRAVDPQEATTWFNALHSAIGKSTQKALLDANRALASIIGELKFIGWLSRRCGGEQNGRSSSESSDELDKWQSIFVAVTDREFRLYESAPWSVEAWSRPFECSPLVTTRLAGAGNTSTVGSNSTTKFDLQSAQSSVFCVRCGTTRGVVSHWLRSETNRDMAAWARVLVQGCHNAIICQREFSFRCLYQVSLKKNQN